MAALGALQSSPNALAPPDGMEEEPLADDGGEDQPQAATGLARLHELLTAPNIAELLGEAELTKIAQDVIRDYELDESSRTEWLQENEKGIDFARQVAKEKSYPWPKAANVIYPLIAEAAIQFNARAYPAIVAGKNVVKAKVLGADPEGQKAKLAGRVSRHMSWQLGTEMEEWEEDTDRLLIMLPIVGTVFRKVWFDRDLGRNRSELITPDKLIVNDNVKVLSRAPRVTQEVELYPYEIHERQQTGLYRDIDIGDPPGDDKDATHLLLEQHRRIDLDGDGYGEPYIVTVHKETTKVLCIQPCFRDEDIRVSKGKVAMIRPMTYYIAYTFMPDPKGGFYGMGFGKLLYATNAAINAALNQLLDTGHMATLGGGFIGNGARIAGGGPIQFKPREWKRVDVSGGPLKDNIVPLPVREPSPVLFNLLEFMVQMGRDLAATKDILTGDNVSAQMPATLGLAMIEQGLKVFTAIFKRVHRALAQELKVLFKLNSLYLNPETYFTFEDEPEAISAQDYDEKSLNIEPVTDPSAVTDMQRLGKVQFLMQFMPDPMFDGMELRKRILEGASIEDPGKLIKPAPPPPGMQVELMHKASQIELMRVQTAALWVKMGLDEATALKLIADAQVAVMSGDLNAQMGTFDMIERTLHASIAAGDAQTAAGDQPNGAAQPAGNPGMVGPPNGPEGAPVPPGVGGGPMPPMGQGQPDLAGAPGGGGPPEMVPPGAP